MGNRLIWKEQYNIGVPIIDKEHKKLLHILNKLFDFGQKEEKSHFACQEAQKYFKDHAIQHFADEEAYMASIGYPGLEAHKRIHRDFRGRMLPALEKELEQTGYCGTSIHHFLGVCAGWLIGHTLMEDRMIVSGEPIRHWENLLPEEEQAAMGQTIAGLLHGMFRLDSRLISNCYAGEKFGDGICCRLVYRGEDGRKWDFFLLFEESLIGSAIGNIMETQWDATDMVLSSVAKYAAKQLVERIGRSFPSWEMSELAEEHLLTYEQFYKIYTAQSPEFSLLFDTGKGYFACAMSISEAPRHKDGISAVTKHAMAKIENRLRLDPSPAREEDSPAGKKGSLPRVEDSPPRVEGSLLREEDSLPRVEGSPPTESTAGTAGSRKRRILVVDDSDFMRKAMLHLLGSDYEVLTADSGMSAIRSITLARPDLVLLDYEMPVCSGSQMLEMIRTQKDFSDIPVIFLTCRVDRESVKKAISLKPAGYLSKSLSTESVKREIDHFFEKKSRTP